MRISRHLVWAFACFVSLVSLHARASSGLTEADKEAIRQLAYEASVDYDAGRYRDALDKFEPAFAAARVPKLALWLAKTHAKLGQLVRALQFCRTAVALEPDPLWIGTVQQQAQAEAARLGAELEQRVARLLVRVRGVAPAGVALQFDGVPVPNSFIGIEHLVDPGLRRITGRAASQVVAAETLLRERERKEVVLSFAPQPANTLANAQTQPASSGPTHSSANPQRLWGWLGVSFGAAGLAVGGLAGIAVAVKHAELRDRCPSDTCGRADWSELDRYETYRAISSIGFVVGGVATIGGVSLLLLSPKSDRGSTVAVGLQPRSIGVHGRF